MTSNSCIHEKIVSKGTVTELRAVYSKLLGCAEKIGFGSDDLFAIQLAIEEAVVNAVKHGNKNDHTKDVVVEYNLTDKKFEFWITDQGGGFAPDKLGDPRSKENLYKTGGRGVLLIKSYMDKVEYNTAGNSVHMVKFNSKSA